MPVVDVDPDELRRLADATDISEADLIDDLFALGLEYEGHTEDDELQLEFAPDRLDRLSVEGVARSLRYQYGHDRGVYVPTLQDPTIELTVDEAVPDERPYVTGAIARNVDLSANALESLIQLQEKLHATMGRERTKGAIGIHDLTMLQPAAGSDDSATVTYTGIEPTADRFVPLESDRELTPAAVLEEHPTGQTYADIVETYDRLPAIYDEIGLFSFPPVINGKRTEVTTDSRDLLIELTGTDQWTIDKMCTIVCYALEARGATIEAVTVDRPDGSFSRPDFATDQKRLSHEDVESMLGIDLDGTHIVELLERSGLSATPDETATGLEYDVEIPPYRVDVLHPVDLIDDIGRAYGFNDLEPQYPDVSTVGGRHEASRFERTVRELLVGCGLEDQLTFNMISEAENFDRMKLAPGDSGIGAREPARIREPYSEEYEIVRTWVLPSLLMVLENNTHRRYPQHLVEIGLGAGIDNGGNTNVAERRSVAAVFADPEATYEDAKSVLAAVCRRLDVSLSTPATEHSSFIPGRTAAIEFAGTAAGVIGELHPSVVTTHDIEVPVAGFEFSLAVLQAAAEDAAAIGTTPNE